MGIIGRRGFLVYDISLYYMVIPSSALGIGSGGESERQVNL
jgi:hypothetical protein